MRCPNCAAADLVHDTRDLDYVYRGERTVLLAVSVGPGASTARRATGVAGARTIRLVAKAAPKRYAGQLDEMAFVHQDGNVPPPGDSVPTPSSLLVLRRNEPVRITIVNHLRAATDFGINVDESAVPADDSGRRRESKARPFAEFLG